MKQLGLKLEPSEPYSFRYFVPHSGVATAVEAVEGALARLSADPTRFELVYLYGAPGSGKTHFVRAYEQQAEERGLPTGKIAAARFRPPVSEEDVARFIARYERLKAGGGLLLCAGPVSPNELSDNPHLTSRLLSGPAFYLAPPMEEELQPLFISLLERRNLRLSEKNLQYLLSRLPRTALSFAAISAKINEICLAEGRAARATVVRQALSTESSE